MTSIDPKHFKLVDYRAFSRLAAMADFPRFRFRRRGKRWDARRYVLRHDQEGWSGYMIVQRKDQLMGNLVHIPWKTTCALIQAARRKGVL